MSSNEEYLDSLLRAMEQKEEAAPEVVEPLVEVAPEVIEPLVEDETQAAFEQASDYVMNMSEDEIMQLLQESSGIAQEADAVLEAESEPILDETAELEEMLKNLGEEDDTLADIQELLHKDENHEAVFPDDWEPLAENEDGSENNPMQEALIEELQGKKKKKEKKEKKEKRGFFFKKKKKEEQAEELTEEPVREEPVIEEPVREESVAVDIPAEDFAAVEELMNMTPVEPDSGDSVTDDLAELLKSLESAEIPSMDIMDVPDPFEVANLLDEQSEEQSEEHPKQLEETEETQTTETEKEDKGKKKKEKGPGFFAKLINFLTEEDEDEEEKPKEQIGDYASVTSEENQEILEQLAKEDQDSKGKKKKKSKKDKKGKKAEEASSADGENEDEEQKDDKKKKKEKKPKEKKKKDPKPIEDETPSPKLSKKKINATVFFALTILAAILLCCLVVPELFELKGARKAYYDGDYESCYKTFYGKKLSDSDKVMYEHSKMLLGIQRQVEAYNNYVAVDDELHALDVLMQAVQKQDALLNEADKQELRTEAEAAYQEILKILEEKYQLSEADAKEINAYEEDAIYTLRLKSIVEHTEFVMPEFAVPNAAEDTTEDTAEENAEEVTVEEPLEDMLPEEEMMEETTAP